MRFQAPLIPGRLIRRYKRFLADIMLDDGREITAHCANPGAMLGLKDPGIKVWVEPNDDPKKKLKFAWRLAELAPGVMAGIDTSAPNKIVKEALLAQAIPELAGYDSIKPEQKYSTNSRIDFLLSHPRRRDTYVEVKNVHLHRQGDWAEFPDCVTERGTKHLHDLSEMARMGHRAVMLYVVQHTACQRFKLADDLDPTYAAAFQTARTAGVETLCYTTQISPTEITLGHAIPVVVG